MASSNQSSTVYRIPPFCYLHVVDQTTNVTRLEIGPKTFIRQDNEGVVLGPERMIVVPPRHYCTIENPVVRDVDGNVTTDASGQAKLAHADLEVRLAQDPFPLWPGEVLKQPVTPLKVILANTGLHLKAVHDFEDESGEKRTAGDEWIFEGPGIYIPRKEVEIVGAVKATVVKSNQAIRIRSRKEFVDREGRARVTGEEWMVKKTGAYLPGAYEEVAEIVNAYVLTEKKSLHMRALRTFKDDFGVVRKNGEEWLIQLSDTDTHIPHVYEEVVGVVNITTLTNRQYCVILDPVDSKGVPQLGRKKVVRGDKSFFLMPGEHLEKGIQNIYVLGENEGLIMKAVDGFKDAGVERKPGDRWMIRGPAEYVPPVEVEVVTKRTAIPLDVNEGIYVRNVKTGKVRAVAGETYMLNHEEELWEKDLPPVVEELLLLDNDPAIEGTRDVAAKKVVKVRDRTRVVTYRVPHNTAVQIYDYKEKKARVVFGPELVMLGPDEQFTQLSLSGGKPKKPNVVRSLSLMLGPDFCTDFVVVETADHARLQLQLAYNWHFEVKNKDDPVESAKLFSVPDFVGDSCKAIASRVRGSVAAVVFDEFHKNSARIIRSSVFGVDEHKKIRGTFVFSQNNLIITSVDIQSVEPVDQRTRDSLQKSVQLAIEITTKSQEAAARHEAERLEQEAKGRLERQKITDEAAAERARKELLELQANSAAVESTGQAKAEAQSRAEAAHIEGQAAVEQAGLKAHAMKIESEAELNRLKLAREAEIIYVRQQNELEVDKTRELAAIETDRFKDTVSSIGSSTLQAIATAGPDMQVKMLQSLGLNSTLITDGNSPINLFTTADGLVGGTGRSTTVQ